MADVREHRIKDSIGLGENGKIINATGSSGEFYVSVCGRGEENAV